jgi:exonuclease III
MHSDISFSNPAATSSPTKSTQQQLQPQKRKDLPMRIVVVNCQSIKSDGKPSQLRNLVSSIQADIVIGTESWLNPTIRDAEVFPEGFKAYRRDRTDGKGGGVFLLISKKYDSSEPEELKVSPQDDIELVWVKIKTLGSNDLYIGSFYKPPGRSDPQYLDKLYSFITRIPTANGAHLWIGGDFNLGDINWEKETVNEYATNGTQCNQLLTITKDTFLDQVVQEPTRVTETTANVLDLFFTKELLLC